MRSCAVEAFLTRAGQKWVYMELVPWAAFNRPRSLANQARGKAIIDDLVVHFQLMLQDGSEPPAVIAWTPPKGGHVLIDGNNRWRAAELEGRLTTDVYLVQSADESITSWLTLAANAQLNGLLPTREQRFEQAYAYHLRFPQKTIKEVAYGLGIVHGTLEAFLRARKVRDALTGRGIDVSRILQTGLEDLHPIENHRVQDAAARLTNEGRLPIALIRELVTQVRAYGTEDEQTAAVERFRRRDDVQEYLAKEGRAGASRPSRPQKARLFGYFEHAISHVRRHPSRAALELYTDEDAKRAGELYNELGAMLRPILYGRQEGVA